MEPRSTELPYKKTESANYTEKASAELKSFCFDQVKGHQAELFVIQYFLNLKFQFVAQRKKLKYGEVDLIFQKQQRILFVEVKTLHNDWMSFNRISKKQFFKLKKNAFYYQMNNKNYEVKSLLAWVKSNETIELVEIN
jgi:Holliday junction resolvase-like predicted endonuclease